MDREFQSRCARKETADLDILITSGNGDKIIMQSIRIISRLPSRIRKGDRLSQFRRTSTKVIPIEETSARYLATMGQEFKTDKLRTQSYISVLAVYLLFPNSR